MLKIAQRIAIILTFFVPISSCQSFVDPTQDNGQAAQSLAKNYLMVHGMCLGKLQNSTLSLEQFKILTKLDLQAKYYVVKALIEPKNDNFNNAKIAIVDIIDYVTQTQRFQTS